MIFFFKSRKTSIIINLPTTNKKGVNNLEYYITDDVTLADAIRYATEIYDSSILDSYIDAISSIVSDYEEVIQ